MSRGQSIPTRWLIVRGRPDRRDWTAMRKLRLGSGVLFLEQADAATLRRIRNLARLRNLTILLEGPRTAARVHDLRELSRAQLRRTPVILLSPILETRSHPDWRALPRMRAAAFARLAGRRLIALGGMTERRYAKTARLGFAGWAGISAFRT